MATKHNHGPNFGKRMAGCPRCDELNNGAAPIVQAWRKPLPFGGSNKGPTSAEIHAHFNSHKHLSGGCGPVCTFGDW